MRKKLWILAVTVCLAATTSVAQQPKGDVFQGKLFPPNVILKHQAELNLSKQQFTAIKAAVVEVQANVAEHEWDVREAYQGMMVELDRSPIDTEQVLEHVSVALKAENEVKKQQVTMLITLKNLLTDEQVAFLASVKEN
ncbi:MAG: hypothetical protein QNK16_11640 [Woeseiaceae bacterium]|nr:hypothetical protein [Woeseiaceae bacterium]MDX2609029.1 hypothetical protein [Woeseiaceae bacterium]